MRKRALALVLAVAMVFALVACSADSTSEGKVGKAKKTDFFTFTVKSAKVVFSYAEHLPAEGYHLLDVVIDVKNTSGSYIEMYDWDFYLQMGEDAGSASFINPLPAMDSTMAPSVQGLEKNESMSYHYIYEVPKEYTECLLCYMGPTDPDTNEADEFFYIPLKL